MKIPQEIQNFINQKIKVENICLPYFYPKTSSFQDIEESFKNEDQSFIKSDDYNCDGSDDILAKIDVPIYQFYLWDEDKDVLQPLKDADQMGDTLMLSNVDPGKCTFSASSYDYPDAESAEYRFKGKRAILTYRNETSIYSNDYTKEANCSFEANAVFEKTGERYHRKECITLDSNPKAGCLSPEEAKEKCN